MAAPAAWPPIMVMPESGDTSDEPDDGRPGKWEGADVHAVTFDGSSGARRLRDLGELQEQLRAAQQAERQYSETLYAMVANKIVSAGWATIQLRLAACVERWRTAIFFLPRPARPSSSRPVWARPAVARERALQYAEPNADLALRIAMEHVTSASRPSWAVSYIGADSAEGGIGANHADRRRAAALREAIVAHTAFSHSEQLLAVLACGPKLRLARALGRWGWLVEASDDDEREEGPGQARSSGVAGTAHAGSSLDERARHGAAVLTRVTVGPVSSLDASLVNATIECGGLVRARRLRPDGLRVRFVETAGASLSKEVRIVLAWRHGERWGEPTAGALGQRIGTLMIPIAGLAIGSGSLSGEWVVPEAPWHRLEVSVERTALTTHRGAIIGNE